MFSKTISFLASLYIWSFIVFSIFPFFVVYMILWLLVFFFDRNHVITHFYTMIWTRLYLTCNPGWKLKVENRDKIVPGRKYILISNHQSIIDIALLLQLRVNFKWISKIELAAVPFVGWVIWMNNHILVKRGDKKSVVMMADACRKALDKGLSVFLFPEGTRSHDGNIQSFKEGAFILARENNVAVVPVVIDGAWEALPKKVFLFKPRQIFTVRVLDEIPAEAVQDMSISQLIDHTRNIMVQELDTIRRPVQKKHADNKMLRQMGFLSDSRGIIDRYIQVNGAWEEHLMNSRNFIIDMVNARKIDELAIYGSGWMLDVPLEELAQKCGHIRLYDIIHPPQVLHKIKRFSNVSAEIADITGGTLNAVFKAVKAYKKNGTMPVLDNLVSSLFKPEINPDFAISINILSQIGELVVTYLRQHVPITGDEQEWLIKVLQENHISMLQSVPSCLITDVYEFHYDVNGQKISEKNLLFDAFSFPEDCRSWNWQFDPLGEYNEGFSTVSKVVAFELQH